MNNWKKWKGPGERYGTSPCKGCSERSATCHTDCRKYLAWKEEADGIRAKIEHERNMEAYSRGRVIDQKIRKWKAKHNKG